MQEETFVDANDRPFAVGSRVRLYHDDDTRGTVTAISDPDGDCDDEGHMIGISPRVTVVFDDGDDDRFSTDYTGDGSDRVAPWKCEDVEVIA